MCNTAVEKWFTVLFVVLCYLGLDQVWYTPGVRGFSLGTWFRFRSGGTHFGLIRGSKGGGFVKNRQTR